MPPTAQIKQGKLPASCLILAGGQGKRLTPDKPLLEIEGKSIIERTVAVVASLFEEVIISTNTPDNYRFLGLPLVADERQGCGPLMGIYSGLGRIRHDVAFVCAADMPFLNQELIRAQYQELGEFDIVAPCPWGRPEYLHAFYRRRCLPFIKQTLDAGRFKIEVMAQLCQTLCLNEDWFFRQGLEQRLDLAFTNINTLENYMRWLRREQPEPESSEEKAAAGGQLLFGYDQSQAIAPEVIEGIRATLIEQETAFQRSLANEPLSSLWEHSSRVGRIARRIAQGEGLPLEPAMLAGLLHDTGKFNDAGYHADDVPEEAKAADLAERLLAGSKHVAWREPIRQAILTMYLEPEATSDLGRVIHDADSLDKMGCLGLAQFFAKNALRRQFLDETLLSKASIELTYAHHAPDTLKTSTGKSWARERGLRTRRFFSELLIEWAQLGLGEFKIIEEDIGGIVCVLVVPCRCSCGAGLAIHSDIRDALKCRAVLVQYQCVQCGLARGYTFCLPKVKGLPST